MKPILLGALALPFLLTACGTYVGVDDGYGGPGYYAYGPSYYDGVYGDVATYGYNRGAYSSHYRHYDGSSSHRDVASRGISHSANYASASHDGGGHVGGGSAGAAHASASVGGGGGHGGGHR